MSRRAWFPILVVALAGSACVAIDTTTFCQKNPTSSSCTDAGPDATEPEGGVDAPGPEVREDAPGPEVLVGACKAGEKVCEGKSLRTCNAEGTATSVEACAIGCSAGACLKVVDISAHAALHTCAVISDGTVRCWGDSRLGALGRVPGATNRPQRVPAIGGVVQVSVSGWAGYGINSLTAVRLQDGTARWWGTTWPQPASLDEPRVSRPDPVEIAGLTKLRTVAVGHHSVCGISDPQGDVTCLGRGPFGDGTRNSFATAKTLSSMRGAASVQIQGTYEFFSVTLGMYGFALFGNQLQTWGDDLHRQMGLGTTVVSPFVSSPLSVLGNVKQAAAGVAHACVVLTNGLVRCAGLNFNGQLGDGTTTNSSTFVDVQLPLGSVVKQIDVGQDSSCAVLTTGKLLCWGSGDSGKLGDGRQVSQSRPTEVIGVEGAERVSVGINHACALLSDGRVRCWGGNGFGEIGDGTGGVDGTGGELVLTPTEPAW
jgi:alpha-tubulin suppressor-like RCC1 family protein